VIVVVVVVVVVGVGVGGGGSKEKGCLLILPAEFDTATSTTTTTTTTIFITLTIPSPPPFTSPPLPHNQVRKCECTTTSPFKSQTKKQKLRFQNPEFWREIYVGAQTYFADQNTLNTNRFQAEYRVRASNMKGWGDYTDALVVEYVSPEVEEEEEEEEEEGLSACELRWLEGGLWWWLW